MITEELKQLNKPINVLLEEYKKEAPYPRKAETGFKNSDSNCGVHAREDGSLELFAGDVRLILDGESGAIILSGNTIIESVDTKNSEVRRKDGFAISNHALSSKWIDKQDYSTMPIVQSGPIALSQQYITGAPAQGQRLASFSEVFRAQKLFLEKSYGDQISMYKKLLEGI